MQYYVDTALLVRMYAPEADSPTVLAWASQLTCSLPFTLLHGLEVRNAIRLKRFRDEFSGDDMAAALAALDSDLRRRRLVPTTTEWSDVFLLAEELSAQSSFRTGCRSLDILHVAQACHLGCKRFVSFDRRQLLAAEAAGLETLEPGAED